MIGGEVMTSKVRVRGIQINLYETVPCTHQNAMNCCLLPNDKYKVGFIFPWYNRQQQE